jgi:hypothetical protein
VYNVQSGRKNVHEEQSGQTSVMSDDLVHSVDQKICGQFHNFRNFTCISTSFTHCSLRDYHSYASMYCVVNSISSYVQ